LYALCSLDDPPQTDYVLGFETLAFLEVSIRAETRCDRVRSQYAIQWESGLKILIEIIGWTAAVMMLSAYVLLTTGRLRSLSPAYQWLNVLSGAGFIVNSGWNGAYPSAALNLIWMAIGLYGLFRGARIQPGPVA
jgi:hypothetical protein